MLHLTKLTKAINDIEDALDVLEKNDFSMAQMPVCREMVSDLKDKIRPLVAKLQDSGENARRKNAAMLSSTRVQFFEDWAWPDSSLDEFAREINSIVDWEFPIMEIFPGNGKLLKELLAGEPLYVVDWDQAILDRVGLQFNEFFRNKRLMQYKIEGYDLISLPQSSFGLICCINYLRFENLQGLNTLASNVYDCLMPGGYYMFNFNPSDRYTGVDYMEQGISNGIDSQDVIKGLQTIGYEIIKIRLDWASYIIAKKPGIIQRIKNSSVLGKVIEKPRKI